MKRRGYWGEGVPASFEFFFSLNRYLDSNGLLQNLLLFFFLFFYQCFYTCVLSALLHRLRCSYTELYQELVIPDYAAGVNGQKSWEVN